MEMQLVDTIKYYYDNTDLKLQFQRINFAQMNEPLCPS